MRLLDEVDAELARRRAEPRVRTLLERGRSLALGARSRPGRGRCSCRPTSWRARRSWSTCTSTRCTWSRCSSPTRTRSCEANQRALATARAARDPQARRWEASLANNIGWSLHDAGRHEEALASFRDALAARERDGADRSAFARRTG